jgi:hypothetical protein
MDIVVNGQPIEDCIERLERLATRSFQPYLSLKIPIISPIIYLLLSFFANGWYLVVNLEAALWKEFGSYRSILNCFRATAAGIRFGFPVTTINTTATCIFTNYNRVGVRPPGCSEIVEVG